MLEDFETLGTGTFPVYRRDNLFPQLEDGSTSSMQGSFFFRHSVQYRVTVLANKAKPKMNLSTLLPSFQR